MLVELQRPLNELQSKDGVIRAFRIFIGRIGGEQITIGRFEHLAGRLCVQWNGTKCFIIIGRLPENIGDDIELVRIPTRLLTGTMNEFDPDNLVYQSSIDRLAKNPDGKFTLVDLAFAAENTIKSGLIEFI